MRGTAAIRKWSRSATGLGDERGQALLLALGGTFVLLAGALALVAISGAVTGKGRVQRAADLAAISAARSMRDDLPRLLSPPTLPNGVPNPAHIDKLAYLARARAAAADAGRANDLDPARLRVEFPDAASFAPLRAKAIVTARLAVGGGRGRGRGSGCRRSRRAGQPQRWDADDGQRWRLQRPARLPQRRGDETRCRRRL
jgi:hypothetical protein